jgi:hypothetical protein
MLFLTFLVLVAIMLAEGYFTPDQEVSLTPHAMQTALVDDWLAPHEQLLSNRRLLTSILIKPVVNMHQHVELLHRFYNTLLRPLIHDPLVHSEWTYFLSMLAQPII